MNVEMSDPRNYLSTVHAFCDERSSEPEWFGGLQQALEGIAAALDRLEALEQRDEIWDSAATKALNERDALRAEVEKKEAAIREALDHFPEEYVAYKGTGKPYCSNPTYVVKTLKKALGDE